MFRLEAVAKEDAEEESRVKMQKESENVEKKLLKF